MTTKKHSQQVFSTTTAGFCDDHLVLTEAFSCGHIMTLTLEFNYTSTFFKLNVLREPIRKYNQNQSQCDFLFCFSK